MCYHFYNSKANNKKKMKNKREQGVLFHINLFLKISSLSMLVKIEGKLQNLGTTTIAKAPYGN